MNNQRTWWDLARLLGVGSIAALTLASGNGGAQGTYSPAPITMPVVTIATNTVQTYQPFTVKAQFSKPYCLNAAYPVLAGVSLDANTLNVQLSHLSSGSCVAVTEKEVTVPGLPAGSYQIRISVTQSWVPGIQTVGTYEAEIGQVGLTVGTLPGEGIARACTAFNRNDQSGGNGGAILTGGICSTDLFFSYQPLEPGGGTMTTSGSFASYRFALPPTQMADSPFLPLYLVFYPQPLLGSFITTSKDQCETLSNEWRNPRSGCGVFAWGLKTVGGACPLGATPVYRLFNPAAIAHRYTDSADTYTTLIRTTAYVGEGLMWCAPKRSGTQPIL